MDYKAVHVALGFDLPSEIGLFEMLHSKLYAMSKNNIYDFLAVETHAVPAATLAFKARAITNRSTDVSEKEIATEIFTLFSAPNKDERKSDYDYFCSLLSVDKVFDEIAARDDIPLHPNVCRHFINKLTDGLSGYPGKPNSTEVFLSFCDKTGVAYSPEMKNDGASEKTPEGEDKKRGAGGRQLINLKSVVKDINTITAEIANICTDCEKSFNSASEQKSTLQSGFLALEGKKPQIDKYLSECVRFSESLALTAAEKDGEEEPKKVNGFLGKVSDAFAKITQPLGKSIDHRIAVIESEPFKYLPEVRNGLQSVEEIKTSLQNLLYSFNELFDGRNSIFDVSDKNIATADIDLGYLRDVTTRATQMCENVNTQNKVANLIDVDAQKTLDDICRLREEATQHSSDVGTSVGAVVTVSNKYISVVNNIRQNVDQIDRKNSETYNYSAATVTSQVSKFKTYNLIGYGAFILSLLFSLPNIIKVITSLFTLDLTWQNGKGVFAFMLIFILIVPVVFMFVRSYWIKFLNQTISTINRISFGFESKIEDFEQFQSNIHSWKGSFVTSSKIFDFLVVLNFIICSVSFVIYVLMAIIAAIVK